MYKYPIQVISYHQFSNYFESYYKMDSRIDEQSPLVQVAATSVRKSAHTYNFFKIGCIKSKSAVVVLFLTFSSLVGTNILNPIKLKETLHASHKVPNYYIFIILGFAIILLGIMFISPMAGLLADIKFGHYKTLRCSSYITLAAISCFFLSFITYTIIISIVTFHEVLFVLIALIFATIGVLITSSIVLTTNAINFGMDQLHDSSTQDSILFVHWYVCLNYLSILITEIPWSLCFYDFWYVDYVDAFRIIGLSMCVLIFGMISFFLILSLCVVHHRQRWFLIESSSRVNPYKLVYRVVKFAWNNKIPVRRSAFTYCEDEWPSRLDLGKQKYGGPFTVEQVEDVKVFLGIFKVLVSTVPLFMLQFVSESMLPRFAIHSNLFFKPPGNTSSHALGHMIRHEGIVHYLFLSSGLLSPLLVVVTLPLYLFLLRPFITYHIPGLLKTILKRIGVGLLLIMLSLLCALAMDVVVHERNSNQLCMFSPNHTTHIVNESSSYRPSLYQNVYFFISQHVLSALYNMLIDIAVFEFIASQSPYSMKGLLIGVLISLRILAQALGIIIAIPFSTSWKTSYPLSCGSGFYITNISIGVITFIVYVLVAKNYKHRTRDEPSFIRQYAEEYYSNIQDE